MTGGLKKNSMKKKGQIPENVGNKYVGILQDE